MFNIDTLLNAITGLFDLVVSLVSFLFTMVRDLIVISGMLGTFITELPAWFTVLMPPGVTPVLVVLLTVTIIYRVTGRD